MFFVLLLLCFFSAPIKAQTEAEGMVFEIQHPQNKKPRYIFADKEIEFSTDTLGTAGRVARKIIPRQRGFIESVTDSTFVVNGEEYYIDDITYMKGRRPWNIGFFIAFGAILYFIAPYAVVLLTDGLVLTGIGIVFSIFALAMVFGLLLLGIKLAFFPKLSFFRIIPEIKFKLKRRVRRRDRKNQ